MGSFVRNLVVLLAAAGFTVAIALPFAFANALPVPINITPTAATPSGLQTMTTFDARGTPGAANAGYYTRPVLVSNNTLAGLARGLARRTLPVLAFTAAVEGAGWAIDALSRQVVTPAIGEPPPVGSGTWCTGSWGASATATMCGPTPQSFIGKSPGWNGNYTITGYVPQTSGSGILQVNNGQVGGLFVQFTAFQQQYGYLDYTPPQPVPDADLAALIRNNPALWNHALRNPDGSVNRNPDVMAEAQALANALANASPSPNPSEAWDTGLQGGPSPGAQGATELDFPVFCSWASKVCELADWLRLDDVEGEAQELPTIDLDLDVSWSSGLGGGSCPAPVVIQVLGSEVAFPYQPLCDLAIYIRPIVIAASAFLALLIIGGFRRA